MKKKNIKNRLIALIMGVTMLFTACGSEAGTSSAGDSLKSSSTESSSQAPTGVAHISEDILFAAENSFTEYLSDTERAELELSAEEFEAFLSFVSATNEKYFAKANTGENYLYSPVSLYLALALCEELTDENATKDLLTTLGVTDLKTLESAVDKIVKGISSETDDKGQPSICRTANSIWSDDELPLDDEAKKTIEAAAKQMFADIYNTNLQSKEAYDAMNKWVEEKTAGLIKEIPTIPDGDTRMILFNALYFKKTWQEEIKKENTQEKDFTLPSGATVKASMMSVSPEEHKYYYKSASTTSAPLYYSDGSYCIFIKPENNCDRQAMNDIMKNELPEIISAYANRKYKDADSVYFKIPKLEYEYKIEDMQDELKALGVSSIFGTTGDPFSPIDGRNDGPLYVTTVAQKCKIIMNEEGTEAAAVTEIMMDECASCVENPVIIDMNLDHSYAYVIMSANHVPLFVGVVEDPTK